MSPTTLFSLGTGPCGHGGTEDGSREGVPGVVGTGGWLGGLYRYPTSTPPGPIFSTYLAKRPYPRPNEGYFKVSHDVS